MNILQDIKRKKQNLLEGKLNVFPYPFPKLKTHIPGWERGHYIIVTANTKVGKTQIADYMYMLYPLSFLYNNRNNSDITLDVVVEYISIENDELTKDYTVYSHFVSKFFLNEKNTNNPRKVPIANLKSLTSPLEDDVIHNIENGKLKELFDFITPKYNIVDNLFTAIQIVNHIHQLGLKYGNFVDGKWIPNNPDLYINIIIDHFSLLLSDTINKNIFDSIGYLSKEIMKLKKVYYTFTFIAIQQQAAQAESIKSIQFRNGEPTLDNLGENKATGRDADLVLGLYSPYRHKLQVHEGMNIMELKDNYRSMSVLADRHYGKIGHFTRLFFDGSYNNFQELE